MPGKQSSLEEVSDAVFGPRALHVDDAVKLNRRHRLQALLDFNRMQDATVTGILSEGRINAEGSGFPFWITNLQTADGNLLKEPLTESDRVLGIPLNVCPSDAKIGDRLRLNVNVVPDHHGEMTKVPPRPFALVAGADLEVIHLVALPVVVTNGSEVLIEQSVWESELKRIRNPLQLEQDQFKVKIEQEQLSLVEKNNVLAQENQQKNDALVELRREASHEETQLQMLKADLKAGRELVEMINRQRDEAMTAYQNMSDFARERATILLALDLISNDQLATLTGAKSESH